MHYISGCPHKDSYTNMHVCAWGSRAWGCTCWELLDWESDGLLETDQNRLEEKYLYKNFRDQASCLQDIHYYPQHAARLQFSRMTLSFDWLYFNVCCNCAHVKIPPTVRRAAWRGIKIKERGCKRRSIWCFYMQDCVRVFVCTGVCVSKNS